MLPLSCPPWARLVVATGILAAVGGLAKAADPAPTPPVKLTIQQCREMVLRKNLNVEAQRLGWQASQYATRAARGIFEPELVLSAERIYNERDNTVEQELSQGLDYFEEDNVIYSGAIEQFVPTGGRLRFGYTLRDLSNNLREEPDGPDANDEYEGFLGVSLSQPLLKGAGPAAALSQIRLANAESDITFQQWRRQAMQTLARAEVVYWQLQLAQEQCVLRQGSVRVAERILEDNRARVQAGKMSAIEVEQAEAGLALRQSRMLDAEQRRVDLANQLKTFFSESLDAGPQFIAADAPVLEQVETDISAAMVRALQSHPDYLMRKRQADQDNIRVAYARNQRWPQIDLLLSYGLNGLGASQEDAWERIMDDDRVAWSIGIQGRFPLGLGVGPRNELAAARSRARQTLMALKAAEVDIGNALDTGVRKVRNQFDQAQRYRTVAELNEHLLASELAQLEAGKSDSRKVLDVEDALTAARDALAESLTRYATARLEMELAGGMLLASRNLEFSGVPRSWDMPTPEMPDLPAGETP